MLASRAGYFCLASNIDNQSEKWLKIIIIPIPICSLRTQPHKNVAQALPQWHKSPEVSGKGRNQAMLLLKRSSQHQWLTHSADCQHQLSSSSLPNSLVYHITCSKQQNNSGETHILEIPDCNRKEAEILKTMGKSKAITIYEKQSQKSSIKQPNR